MYWLKRLIPAILVIALMVVGSLFHEVSVYACGDDGGCGGGADNGQGGPSDKGQGPQKGRIDFCCNFDSDRNVGLAPVVVDYFKLKDECKNNNWDLDINVASQLPNPSYAYWKNYMGEPGKPIEPGINDKGFPGFVQVYDPGGLGELIAVAGSKTLKSNNWSNAVDGDTYWYSGTTIFTCKGGYEPWAIFQFADYSSRHVNKIRMLNDTGICDGEGAFNWENGGKNSGNKGGGNGGGSGGGCGGDDGGCSHDDTGDDGGCSHDDTGDDGGCSHDDTGDDGGCSHDDTGEESDDDGGGCEKDHTTAGDDPADYSLMGILSCDKGGEDSSEEDHEGGQGGPGSGGSGGSGGGGGCSGDDGCGGDDGSSSHGGPCKTIESCDAQFVSKFKVYGSMDGYSYWYLLLDEYMDATTLTPCDLSDGWVEWDIPPTEAKFFLVVFEEPFPSESKMWIHLGEFEVWYETTLADADLSSMSVTGDDLEPNGSDKAKIRLSINDANGQSVSGLTEMDIKLFSKQVYGKQNIDNECTDTDVFSGLIEVSPGVYSISMTSTKAGLKEIKASINGVVLTESVVAAFGMDEEIGVEITSCARPDQLVFVRGTQTAAKGNMTWDWSNAVDGDFDGWDGTVRARGLGETGGPAWGVFRFCDQEMWNFDYVCLTTENGEGAEDQATHFEVWVSATEDVNDAYTKVADIRRKGDGDERWYHVGAVQAKYIKLVMTYPVNRYPGDWRQLVEFAVQSQNKTGPWKSSGNTGIVELPQSLSLQQNYPNPFNPSTQITYNVPEDSRVTLQIYDIQGRHVMELFDGFRAAGIYNVEWHAEDMSSGVYFYRMQAGRFSETKRMLLIK